MLGVFFALLAGASFAWTNAAVRRGVVTGSVTVATTLSIPTGVPVFLAVLFLTGSPGSLFELSQKSMIVFAAVGVSHFIVGRYSNYRALKAIGANLAGPVMQTNLLVSLGLAIFFLGEQLTPLRILGIALVVAGPLFVPRDKNPNAPTKVAFTPRYVEGYAFALLAGICYGLSPPLIRYAVDGHGLAVSLSGGVIAAASASVVILLLLLVPGHWREVRSVEAPAARWFLWSGVMVYVSQIFAYMAVALAPVTITAPIIGLAHIWRLYFARTMNPEHEVFGSAIILGTAVSFLGVIVLALSGDAQPYVEAWLPASWAPFLQWKWPSA